MNIKKLLLMTLFLPCSCSVFQNGNRGVNEDAPVPLFEKEMREGSFKVEFERTVRLRDQIATLKNDTPVMPPQKKVKYGKKRKG
ncbi:MAG: hypothetical protein AB8D78_00155 [Akkermansiaceae bacterium]